MTDKPKRPRDANQLAKFIVDVAAGEVDDRLTINTEGQRKGGLKGGTARAEKLTDAERTDIARKAAAARWSEEET